MKDWSKGYGTFPKRFFNEKFFWKLSVLKNLLGQSISNEDLYAVFYPDIFRCNLIHQFKADYEYALKKNITFMITKVIFLIFYNEFED